MNVSAILIKKSKDGDSISILYDSMYGAMSAVGLFNGNKNNALIFNIKDKIFKIKKLFHNDEDYDKVRYEKV